MLSVSCDKKGCLCSRTWIAFQDWPEKYTYVEHKASSSSGPEAATEKRKKSVNIVNIGKVAARKSESSFFLIRLLVLCSKAQFFSEWWVLDREAIKCFRICGGGRYCTVG